MDKLKLIVVMFIWGSIGLITRWIDLPPISLAFLRSLLAIPVLLYLYLKSSNKKKLKLNKIYPFIISGVFMGLGWAFLFMAFDKMSISKAILIYNMCPVYVLIISATFFKEKAGYFQWLTIGASFIGLYMIVGNEILIDDTGFIGIFFAMASGILYAAIVLINHKVNNKYNINTTTLIQIISATVTLLPFQFIGKDIRIISMLSLKEIILIITLGFVHTGIAFHIYFSVYKKINAIEIVSLSYLEPLFSIVLASVFLGEYLTLYQMVGGIIILLFTYLNEVMKVRLITEVDKIQIE